MLTRLARLVRDFLVHSVRHANYPVTAAEARRFVAQWRPVPGPFDWSLALGTCSRAEFHKPGNHTVRDLVRAWHRRDARARACLARSVSLVLSRLHQETTIHYMTDLPRGFSSDAPLPVSSLIDTETQTWPSYRTDFWPCHKAVSYEGPVLDAGYDDDVLDTALPVTGKNVLLLDTVTDRPQWVSRYGHAVQSRGAAWVGFLTLLHVEDSP